MEIIDLIDKSKLIDDEVLPIEKEQLLKNIQAISNEISMDYVEGIDIGIEDALLWKNIILAKDHPLTCHNFIDGLNPELFERLQRIVSGLMVNNYVDKLKDIIEATFNITSTTLDERTKAEQLVTEAISLKIDFEEKAMELSKFSRQAKMLSDLFTLFSISRDEEYKRIAVDRLSYCSIENIDLLIDFCKYLNIRVLNQDSYNENKN
jgi:hypothetical protein